MAHLVIYNLATISLVDFLYKYSFIVVKQFDCPWNTTVLFKLRTIIPPLQTASNIIPPDCYMADLSIQLGQLVTCHFPRDLPRWHYLKQCLPLSCRKLYFTVFYFVNSIKYNLQFYYLFFSYNHLPPAPNGSFI